MAPTAGKAALGVVVAMCGFCAYRAYQQRNWPSTREDLRSETGGGKDGNRGHRESSGPGTREASWSETGTAEDGTKFNKHTSVRERKKSGPGFSFHKETAKTKTERPYEETVETKTQSSFKVGFKKGDDTEGGGTRGSSN